MRRITIFLLPLALNLGACDIEEQSPRAGELPEDPAAAHDASGDNHHARGPGKMLDRLCGHLDCSDEQRVSLEDFMRDLRSDTAQDDRRAHHQALADAFRADTLDLDELQSQRPTGGEAQMKQAMTDALVGLHGILDGEQRAAFAKVIEKRGPMLLGAHGAGGELRPAAEHHGRRGHMGMRICELVSCTADQNTRIEEVIAGRVDPTGHEAAKAHRAQLAAAFSTAEFGPTDVAAHFEAMAPQREHLHKQQAQKVVAVHALLSPEQRAIVADLLAEQGPRGLFGHRGGGHRGMRHGKRHGDRRPTAG